MSKKNSIAVAGAGIGGLAVSIRLASKGFKVTVFEQSDRAGGKVSEIRHQGFRFDIGPSLFTLPELVDELLELPEKENKPSFVYHPLDIICRYFYPDGTRIDAYQDAGRFAEEIERVTGSPREEVIKYLKKSATIYDLTRDIFIFNDLRNIRNLFNTKTLFSLLNAWKLEPFKTMHASNKSSFQDQRVVQLFDRYATYNGSNPYSAPATLKVIPHLEHNIGAYFPEKGMYSIVEALMKKGHSLGVDYRFSERIEQLNLNQNKFTGLITEKGEYTFDKLVANIDIFTLSKLLQNKKRSRHPKGELSTSAIIFYWGMKIKTEQLLLHNILFSVDYRQEFEALFKTKTIQADPTVYIFISSKMVEKDSPEGHENWFVMINAPENTGQDWQELTKKARQLVLTKIKKMLGIDVEKHLVFEQSANPFTIEATTGSYHGSLYGLSSNSVWSAFRRHPNYRKSTRGMYFVGGSVHPGGGIPLVLASAKIVGNLFPNLKEHDR